MGHPEATETPGQCITNASEGLLQLDEKEDPRQWPKARKCKKCSYLVCDSGIMELINIQR